MKLRITWDTPNSDGDLSVDRPSVLTKMLRLADEAEQRAFAEANRRLRDAYRAEFEYLLAEVRGEVGS